jgi:putative nucleotidyltransferase with HDIG domain
MAPTINIEQIRRAAKNNIPLTIKTYKLAHETEEYIDKVIGFFLKEIGYDQIASTISYCVKELAVNAKKANTKRIYFNEQELDINNAKDYETGMKDFKTITLGNINYYLEKQKDAGLYVKIVLRTSLNNLEISIHNNVEITKKEQMRIYDRIARSRAFKSMEEAFNTVLDSSEGAGLGIVILILMLKKIGLSEDSFELDIVDEETVTKIVVPFTEVRLEKVDLLTDTIVKEINTLPQFPENLIQLQRLIKDPESEINDIAKQVSTDPALTADLLKLVNSALYMLPKKIDNISEAVKLVGMKGLENLLLKHGTQKILKQKYAEMKKLWSHSHKVAFYAYNLAKTFRRKKDVWDDAYVGGILHDLGKIIINSLHPDLLLKIQKYCLDKDIPVGLIEDFSVGLNHAEIGSRIALKWNFPDQLINAIHYHHMPLQGEEQYKDVIYVVYLANILCSYELKMIDYDQFERKVLVYLGITSEEQLKKILNRLQRNFSIEN